MITKEFTKIDETTGNAWYLVANTIDLKNNKIAVTLEGYKDSGSMGRGAKPMLVKNYLIPYALVQQSLAGLPDGQTGQTVVTSMVEQYLVAAHLDFQGGVIS